MTQESKKLIEKLDSLSAAERMRHVQRWLQELEEESGDGATKEPPRYEDIAHLAGSIKDAPSDLSYNPLYMEGFGEKSMGRLKHIPLSSILGVYKDLPADLSTNPAYMEGFGE